MMRPDFEKWLGAMESEIESMHDKFGTWLIQSMVCDISVVNGVLKKTDNDINVHIYKS
jgi:hypothetical protein